MATTKSILLVLPLIVLAYAGKTYHDYAVIRTGPLNSEFTKIVINYASDAFNPGFTVWREPKYIGDTADIMASPEKIESFQDFLSKKGIGYSIMVKDVQKLIDESMQPVGANQESKSMLDFNKYHRLAKIYNYMDQLAEKEDWINVVSIGQSYEGREMKVLRITKAGEGAPNVWIEAGIHAREWIAPAMATYFMSQLLENPDTNPDYLNKLNFYILPSANPDGYEYSHTDDRLWRKNRNRNDGSCRGVDLNRNWGYHYGESGVSDYPCSDTYNGEGAFSEPETSNIKNYIEALDPIPIIAHSLHSYSQLWMWPYGYDYGQYPDNVDELTDLAVAACDALEEVHGTIFDPINSADLYPAAGDSNDWYKGVLDARFAYTTELRDTGFNGFILPPDEIIPSGEELWAAEEVVFQKMIEVSSVNFVKAE